ncbi:hypothetical protein [Manganibacter manganicus]|uniref:hypothetical protein n=1 Tax=Manganibacter manganicus TaxID=1873176 RepID=UPI0009BAFE4F|nr:hypothetical protein [Pseudaminobacter manganicus]
MQNIPDGVFKPKPTSAENKNATTTHVARSIIEGEATKRAAKTERLRNARLAKEAQEVTTPMKLKPAKRSPKSRGRHETA